MICFRDMTFCRETECKNFGLCVRSYTVEIEEAAGYWWESCGGKAEDAPVAFFANRPECFESGEAKGE